MALPGGSGTNKFLPMLRYNAKEGRFFLCDRVKVNDQWEATEVEAPLPVSFLADFQSLEIGWTCFKSGSFDVRYIPYPIEAQLTGEAPDFGPRPSPDHKIGFRMLVKARDGVIRHFGHASQIVYSSFSALHDQFLKTAEAQDLGKAAVITVTEVKPITGKNGKNYEPRFQLGRFVARPEDLEAHQPAPASIDSYAPVGAGAGQGQQQEPPPGGAMDDDLPFN